MDRLNQDLWAQINNLPARVSIQDESNFNGVMNHFDVLFKIVILGNTGVGKTCILKRLTRHTFEEEHGVTIGVEFGNFGMIVKEQTYVKLQIWDTAGQESFRSITRNFYQGSDGVFLVFDITQRTSFEDIQNQWLREIRDHTSPSIVIYLIGNFADMEENREVSFQEAFEFARDQQFSHYIETSAKTGQNVHEVFQTLTKHFYLLNEDNLDRFVSTTQFRFADINIARSFKLYRKIKMKRRVSVVQVLSNSDKLNPTTRFPLLNNNQNQVSRLPLNNRRIKSANVEA